MIRMVWGVEGGGAGALHYIKIDANFPHNSR
jgi:hypothetical protein